jgi:glutathione S-transferase
MRSLWARDVPSLEAGVIHVITPMVRRVVRMAYKITPENAQRSLERVRGVFRQLDELLSDGRRFLVGERFTAPDLTFAALAAPVLLPAECRAVQPAFDDVPLAMREEILRFRETDAGQFALRMFSQERDRRVSTVLLASAP